MKVWKKYTKKQKKDFFKKYPCSNWQIVANIFAKQITDISKSDWKILQKIGVTNYIGNYLVPEFLRKFLCWLMPFLDWRKHDLNCSLGGGLYEYFNAHYGILKYGTISIYRHFKNGYVMMGLYSLIIGLPVNLLATVLVILFSWTSFNFVKLEKHEQI